MVAGTPPSKLPLYEASTQFKHWRYSQDQLAHVRSSLNLAAVAVIRRNFETNEPGSSTAVSFLTPEEEQLLVKLYITKIGQLCGLFGFPEEVEATSITYLKRFYLKNTVMDWHPKNVMLTTLFLAAKTTNNAISLDAYTSRIPHTSPSDVLDLEFLVAQSLSFEFAVWHAHTALWGIWLDYQDISDASTDQLRAMYDAALVHVRAARLTDAELIYTPSQIALACLSLSADDLQVPFKWAPPKGLQHSEQVIFALGETIDQIKTVITQTGESPQVELVREVDRRLKLCKNPQRVVGSKAYLAIKDEKEKRAEQKKIRKSEGEDPFGDNLAGDSMDDDDDGN